MEMTQMNTRIPSALKANGDEVLARFGKTASEVMRSVWEYMVKNQQLPECVCDPSTATPDEIAQKLERVQQSSHLAQDFLAGRGLTSMPVEDRMAMKEEMYAAMLEEYEALHD